jgi:serine protease Do
MQPIKHCLLLIATLVITVPPVYAETVTLKGGQILQVDIIKSAKDAIFCDLGFDILRLPRNEILEITNSEPNNTSPDQPQHLTNASQSQLYYSTTLPKSSIEKNTQRFAQAVVMVNSPLAQGSGFIISAQGHVITNYHVIAQETRIRVTVFHESDTGFEQTQHKKVRIMAFNPLLDLALLKIEECEEPFKHVFLGNINTIKSGESVFAIGNPLGLTRTVSQGIVSTSQRNYNGQLYVQTTTDINPGNSGGPLFNLRGEVIGVTSMGYLYLGGLNFAIPVDVVKRFIDNWDAFAFSEDNPNSGYRYLQPGPHHQQRPTTTP